MARVARSALLTAFVVAATVGFAPTVRGETVYGVTINDFLVSFDSGSPAASTAGVGISGLENGEHVVAMDVQPGTNQLFALSSTGRLYTLDSSTGLASFVGRDYGFVLSGSNGGMAFDRPSGHLRLVSSSDRSVIIDESRAETMHVGKNISYPRGDANQGMDPNVTQIGSNTAGPMFGIDTGLDTLVRFGSLDSGDVQTVGNLGVDATESGGFVVSDNGVAYAAFHQAGTDGSVFYTIDLATGLASSIGELDSSSGYFTSLALAPEPASAALVALGAAILSLRRAKR